MRQATLYLGDCVEVLRGLDAESVDAVVCDPPYGLEFMGKEWDSLYDRGRHAGTDRTSLMKKASHMGGNTTLPSFQTQSRNVRCENCNGWKLSGERTRCSCDSPRFKYRGLGTEQQAWHAAWVEQAWMVLKPGGHLLAFGGTRTYHRLACAIEDAGFEIRDSILSVGGLAWVHGQGFPKSHNGPWGGTALKPAHEPIVVARKPLIGTVAANVERFGTGALNVDGCRVSVAPWDRHEYGISGDEGRPDATTPCYGKRDRVAYEQNDAGRWPPNLLLSHDPECAEDCAEWCPVAEMDRQSGPSASPLSDRQKTTGTDFGRMNDDGWSPKGHIIGGYADSGGASRFFPCFRYEAKPSRAERNAGLEGMPLRAVGGHLSTSDGKRMGRSSNEGANERETEPAANHHPTVKPVALMAWLCRLVTPKDGLVLDPFLGSGTTGIAALREGFRFLGVERETDYLAIAERRIRNDAPMFNNVSVLGR